MKKIYLIVLLYLLSVSCSDFLKEYSSDLAYVRSYEDLDELLIGETYMEMKFGVDGNYYPYIHMMADETRENSIEDWLSLDYNLYSQKYFGYITWQYRVGYAVDKLSTTAEDTDWDKMYKHINLANMILYEIDRQEAETEADYQAISRIRGEAYFLRAAYYFILINLYGQPYQASVASTALGVPVKTSPAVEDKDFQRETLKTVYALIVDDLEHAAENLENIPRKSVYRAGITAVRLLQSRVCLYMQNWKEAAKYAQMCLDLQSDLRDLRTFDSSSSAFAEADSPEVIFSMGGNNISNVISMMFMGLSVSKDLIACYEEGDLRSKYFIVSSSYDPSGVYGDYAGDIIDNGYYDVNKYVRLNETYNADVSDKFMFRTAEAWLNLAEAQACLGNENAAIEALDHLRQNRIEADAYRSTTLSGDDLIEEIRMERRRELCFEGHRWFDLRRYTVCEKAPFMGVIHNTYTTNDSFEFVSIQTYELKAGDPAWTLQIPYEVLEFEDLSPNPREERTPISTSNMMPLE